MTRARREGLLWTHWEEVASRNCNRTVVIDALRETSWTARMLTEAAIQYATPFTGHRTGERIAFRLPNGPEWLALFLASQKAGLAAVPLDADLPMEGCVETARRFGARALYVDGEFHALPKIRRKKKICCCLKLTSGSGGPPKAVECRPEHLLTDGRQIIETMRIRARDRNLAAIPLGHSYGLGNLVMPLILQGTSVVCAARFVPRQILEWIERHRATVFPGVPALFRILSGMPSGPKLNSLRLAISAGAVLDPAIARAFFQRYGVKIHNFYGSSETGGICYDLTGASSLSGRSVGSPLSGVAVSIKNRRILVESGAVAARGNRRRLPDCGEWNERGELVLLGRAGRGANIGGKKVHPSEVERALRSLAGVTDAVVWLDQSKGRDFLAAGVETDLSRTEIEAALSKRLPAWKLPKSYFIAGELPRTARGKLSIAAMR